MQTQYLSGEFKKSQQFRTYSISKITLSSGIFYQADMANFLVLTHYGTGVNPTIFSHIQVLTMSKRKTTFPRNSSFRSIHKSSEQSTRNTSFVCKFLPHIFKDQCRIWPLVLNSRFPMNLVLPDKSRYFHVNSSCKVIPFSLCSSTTHVEKNVWCVADLLLDFNQFGLVLTPTHSDPVHTPHKSS